MFAVDFSKESLTQNFSFYLPPGEIHLWLTRSEQLRFLLSCYLKIPPQEIMITRTERGKPLLEAPADFFFNSAHSGVFFAFVFARHPVGIDLELQRRVRARRLADKFFFPHEIKFLEQSPEKNFFFLWTAKEAALKADGCGISRGLRQTKTIFQKDSLVGVELNKKRISLLPWFLESSSGSYLGALASLELPFLIRWYDWRSGVKIEV